MKTILDREGLVFNPPEPGCVLYLPGLPGGASKIYDRSPYSNIGTMVGTTWVRLPSGLWCLSFDGTDDYVNVAAADSLVFTGEITIELWAKFDKVTGDQSLVQGDVNSPYGVSYWLEIVSQKLLCAINGTYEYGAFPNIFEIGNWYHIAMTYDKTLAEKNIKGYVNGKLHTWKNYTGDINGCEGVKLGREGTDRFELDGSMTLVKLINHCRSALEVQNNFNREKHLFGVW